MAWKIGSWTASEIGRMEAEARADDLRLQNLALAYGVSAGEIRVRLEEISRTTILSYPEALHVLEHLRDDMADLAKRTAQTIKALPMETPKATLLVPDADQDGIVSLSEFVEASRGAVFYPAQFRMQVVPFGIVSEAGEAADAARKIWEHDDGVMSEDSRIAILKNLAQSLWYWADMAEWMDINIALLEEQWKKRHAKRPEKEAEQPLWVLLMHYMRHTSAICDEVVTATVGMNRGSLGPKLAECWHDWMEVVLALDADPSDVYRHSLKLAGREYRRAMRKKKKEEE